MVTRGYDVSHTAFGHYMQGQGPLLAVKILSFTLQDSITLLARLFTPIGDAVPNSHIPPLYYTNPTIKMDATKPSKAEISAIYDLVPKRSRVRLDSGSRLCDKSAPPTIV